MKLKPVDDSVSQTLSDQAYDKIRHDILKGVLMPGSKLQIEAISERYAIGIVPVREALNRLSSQGLVERRNNRGFSVSSISLAELEELVKTRIWLETQALRESIANHNEAWEEALVVNLHRLIRTRSRSDICASQEISDEWEARHREFHLGLLANCGSAWLIEFCTTLMDQSNRYRNLSMNTNPDKARREGSAEEHKAIVEATLDHDADRACELLGEHYRKTLANLRGILQQREESTLQLQQVTDGV